MLLIVMGVTGSGKSTIGRRLATRLNLEFHDADDHHPPANRAKMAQDIGLTDEDREPWLESLSALTRVLEQGRGAVLACSALRASYRDRLVAHSPEHRFIFLELTPAAAAQRLEQRKGSHEFVTNFDHILSGQFRELEPPQQHSIHLWAELPPEELVERAARALGRQGYDGATCSYLARGSTTGQIDNAHASELMDELLSKLGAMRRVLLVPPDFTRYHSGAGALTSMLYRALIDRGSYVEVLPATGTHVPVSEEERKQMFPGIPRAAFREHDFRTNLHYLGEVPSSFVKEVSAGLVDYPIRCEVDRALVENWDRIISVGQLVPHEVIGIANHNKNIFVGAGGKDVIDRTHFLGAVCNMESIMGRSRTPVRDVFDYMSGAFGRALPPITYLLTVRGKERGELVTRGIYAGDDNGCFIEGAHLARLANVQLLPKPIKKAVVYLDPSEFKSTWLGNKAIYRTRLALADDAELLIIAPGVRMFGEDPGIDRLIRRHGYHGTRRTLDAVEQDPDLAASLSAAAHLIHGSSEGRFKVTYATGGLTRPEVEAAGFAYLQPERAVLRYDPTRLDDGINFMADGEEVFYISNPALGLWALEEQFNHAL